MAPIEPAGIFDSPPFSATMKSWRACHSERPTRRADTTRHRSLQESLPAVAQDESRDRCVLVLPPRVEECRRLLDTYRPTQSRHPSFERDVSWPGTKFPTSRSRELVLPQSG